MKILGFIFAFFPLLNALAQSTGTIHGNVKDSLQPIGKIQLLLMPIQRIAQTDSTGTFQFTAIPYGEYELRINDAGYKPFVQPVSVHASEIHMGDLLLQTNESRREVRIQRRARREAMDLLKMKESVQILTIKSKESLDKLPNKSAADLASRMPSVLLFRSKGEGNMVSLRGTPTDWTSVLVDGDRLPVACEDNTTRSFEFEAFPSDFVGEVVELRSVTPDLESDNIGGSLNFLSLQPTAEKRLQFDGSLGFNFKGNKPSGDANILYNNRSKNEKWQLLLNGTYFGRAYASEAIKTIFGSNLNHGVNRLELRKYDGFRATSGLQFAVNYLPSPKWEWKIHGFWGRMTDDKHMNKVSFNWYEDNGQRVRLQNCFGQMIRQIQGTALSLVVKPKTNITGTFRLAGYLNQFKNGPVPFARNDPRNGFLVTEFQSPELNFNDLAKVTIYGEPIDPNAQDYALLKLVGPDNPYGNGDDPLRIFPNFTGTLKASDFEYTESYTEINRTKETDPVVFRNDWEVLLKPKWNLQMGVKYRLKIGERSLSKHEWLKDFTSGNSAPIMLSDFHTEPFQTSSSVFLGRELGDTYAPFTYDFLTTNALQTFLTDQENNLREIAMTPLHYAYYEWVGSRYKYEEQQSSGYAMATYAGKKIALLAGIRFEHTYLHQSSDTLTSEIALDTASNTYYNVPESRSIRRAYLGFLPSVNFNCYLTKKSILKWAFSRTMHRPNFEETKPGHAVIRYNEMIYTFGNPLLKPVFSYNADLSFEHYQSTTGLFSAGIYFKYIKDHIYTLSALNVDPMSGITVRKYGNAPSAWVGGLELVYNRQFDFLPGFAKNFGIRSNLTLSVSRMKIEGRTQQVLTKNTPLLYNVNVYYEGKKLSFNAALLYSSRYVNELNLTYVNGELLHKNSDYDTYTNQNYALEGSIQYAINDHWTLEGQFANLLNFPEQMTLGTSWRSSYVEYYGTRIQLGVHYAL
jgi:TonB-dependent receptor